jgi:hypothetical protein
MFELLLLSAIILVVVSHLLPELEENRHKKSPADKPQGF